jgi:hypothetical protein
MLLNFGRPSALGHASLVGRNRMSNRAARAPFSKDVPPSARAPPHAIALVINRTAMFSVEIDDNRSCSRTKCQRTLGQRQTNINKPGQPV